MERFNKVTKKLNKMFKGSEEEKDSLVVSLKSWVKKNKNTDDKQKLHAITAFLAKNGIV